MRRSATRRAGNRAHRYRLATLPPSIDGIENATHKNDRNFGTLWWFNGVASNGFRIRPAIRVAEFADLDRFRPNHYVQITCFQAT